MRYKTDADAAVGGCMILAFLGILITLGIFSYWVAYRVAEYFGLAGWVGCGLLFLVMIVANALRPRKGE